jgi:tRNA A-37 threonylcarbamoyl transferase component Bud32
MVWLMACRAGGEGDYVGKRFVHNPVRQRAALLVGRHPAQLELRANRALRAAGVPTVPIMDCGIEPAGAGCHVWLITPRLGESLQRRLREDGCAEAQREGLMLAAAALTRRLLEAGFTFRDLKPSNIVVDAQGRGYLLDVGSVRHTTSPARVASMLSVMERVLTRDGVNEALRRRYVEAVQA